MSDNKPVLDPKEQAQKLLEQKKKENFIKEHKISLQYEEIIKNKKEVEALGSIDITNTTDEYINQIVEKSKKFFQSSKNTMNFINNIPELNNIVPMYAGQIIGIGAYTGDGKSTACANLLYSLMLQGKRPLLITNEETAEHAIGRVAALIADIRYGNHSNMTQENTDKILELIPKVSKKMAVIDNFYGLMNGAETPDTTTTIEGVEWVFKRLVEKFATNNESFDCIVIDYFQNVSSSKLNPALRNIDVLGRFTELLERFRNEYPAPVVVFAQMKLYSKDSDEPYSKRIQWCSHLANRTSCFLEMRSKKSESATEWVLHKSRFNDYVATSFLTGWEKGRYVPYTEEFKKKQIDKKLKALDQGKVTDGKKS